MPGRIVPGRPEPVKPEKEKSGGPPIFVIAGMLFVAAIVVMIVVSIIKAPVKENADKDGGGKPGG